MNPEAWNKKKQNNSLIRQQSLLKLGLFASVALFSLASTEMIHTADTPEKVAVTVMHTSSVNDYIKACVHANTHKRLKHRGLLYAPIFFLSASDTQKTDC